jgi:hypothetical protein
VQWVGLIGGVFGKQSHRSEVRWLSQIRNSPAWHELDLQMFGPMACRYHVTGEVKRTGTPGPLDTLWMPPLTSRNNLDRLFSSFFGHCYIDASVTGELAQSVEWGVLGYLECVEVDMFRAPGTYPHRKSPPGKVTVQNSVMLLLLSQKGDLYVQVACFELIASFKLGLGVSSR